MKSMPQKNIARSGRGGLVMALAFMVSFYQIPKARSSKPKLKLTLKLVEGLLMYPQLRLLNILNPRVGVNV